MIAKYFELIQNSAAAAAAALLLQLQLQRYCCSFSCRTTAATAELLPQLWFFPIIKLS